MYVITMFVSRLELLNSGASGATNCCRMTFIKSRMEGKQREWRHISCKSFQTKENPCDAA